MPNLLCVRHRADDRLLKKQREEKMEKWCGQTCQVLARYKCFKKKNVIGNFGFRLGLGPKIAAVVQYSVKLGQKLYRFM